MKKKEEGKPNKDENVFNKYILHLKHDKKLLKAYSHNIDSYININIEHKNSLTKIINELDKNSSLENHPFHFFKDFQIILKLQYLNFNLFWEKIEKQIEHLKNSVNINLTNISGFISTMENLEENIKLKSQFIHEQNNFIMNSYKEAENEIAEDYFKHTYKININKKKNSKFELDKLIEDCHKSENDYFALSKEIQNIIKKYIEYYNSNINQIKGKIIDLIKITKDNLVKILLIFKEKNDVNQTPISLEETIQNLQCFDINKDEFESNLSKYLNYQIKEEEFLNILKIKHYKIKIKDKINTKLIKLYELKPNKTNLNLVINDMDIYNIAKQLYSYDLKMIDKDYYNIDLEKNKIEIAEKLGKLLGYDFFQKSKIKIEISSEEETNIFINSLFLKEDYLLYFLSSLSSYRVQGEFGFSEKQFDIFKLIFCKISDYLLEHSINKIGKFLIILSQTFYKTIKGEKYFLRNEIKHKEFFTNDNFWKEFLESSINYELNQFEKQSNKMNLIEDEKNTTIKDIILNKLTSLIPFFKGFEIRKETINNILEQIINKYNIDEEGRKKLSNLDNLY